MSKFPFFLLSRVFFVPLSLATFSSFFSVRLFLPFFLSLTLMHFFIFFLSLSHFLSHCLIQQQLNLISHKLSFFFRKSLISYFCFWPQPEDVFHHFESISMFC